MNYEREPGYYWVKPHWQEEWIIARFDHGDGIYTPDYFWVVGKDWITTDGFATEIDEQKITRHE